MPPARPRRSPPTAMPGLRLGGVHNKRAFYAVCGFSRQISVLSSIFLHIFFLSFLFISTQLTLEKNHSKYNAQVVVGM